MNSFAEIFELFKKNLNITEIAKKSWIDPIKPVKINNNKIVLYVDAPFVKQILEDNYIAMFKNNFKEILGFDVEIEILCHEQNELKNGQINLIEPIPELQDDEVLVQKLEKSEADGTYKYTFDTFIVGESNKLAYTACKSIAQGANNLNTNPLYIYGDPGLGKTHLLSAIKNEIKYLKPNLNIVFVPADTFINDFITGIKVNNLEAFKKKYGSADFLLIDDIQFLSGKKECQQALFNIFNELHGAGKQIVLTSDRAPKEINDIEVRLRSRFESGLLADIVVPELETRASIIKRKAELINLNLQPSVITYIAERLKNNIRQLEGAVNKMNAMYLVTEMTPSLTMAKSIVDEVMTESVPAPVTVERVVLEVASIYGVTPDEIRSQRRSAQISTARQISIYVVNKITGMSYTEIGREFGGRDHSTIVYAINKVKSIIQKDKSYSNTIEDLIKNIGNS